MVSNKGIITRLKNQIKDMDGELLTLLARRVEAVRALTVHENLPEDEIFYAPEREAIEMRAFFYQNNGVIPIRTLAKVLREMISVEEQLHKPFSVAVYAKEQGQDMLELAKNYFGVCGNYVPCLSLAQTLQKVESKESGVAVMPLFEQAEESWWTVLVSGNPKELKIVAKLPFLKWNESAHGKEGFVVSTVPFNESGQDCSLYAIEMATQTSIAALKSQLENAGLIVKNVWPARHLSRVYLFAVELEGYVKPDDERLQNFAKVQEHNLQVLRSIGGYPIQEGV